MKHYVCTNFVECQAAQDKKEQEVPEGMPFKCEVCGSESGTEIKKSSGVSSRNLIIGGGAALVVLILGVSWFTMRSSGSDKQQEEVVVVPEEAPKEDSATITTGILVAMDSVQTIKEQIEAAKQEKNTLKLELLGRNMDSITKSFEAKIKKLEADKGGDAKQISKLQSLLANLHNKYDALEKERDEALKELAKVKEELEVSRGENRSLTDNLQKERRERSRIEAEKDKSEREAEQALFKSELEAYIEKGNNLLELAETSFKAGENFTFINNKKKKAAYREAKAKFEDAKKHFESPPPGKGGFSGDAAIKARFQQGIKDAEAGILKASEKLD